jgi:predicted phosphohydrolase
MNQIKKCFKFQLFSDIHLEFFKDYPKIVPLTDYLFLAGDIGKLSHPTFKPFFDYCSNKWKKTFYVLGNHEYYSSDKTHQKLNESYKEFFSSYSNVHLLDDSYYDLEDENQSYRIYGSTLWSEINSTDGLNDFNMIKMKNEKNWTVPINISYYNDLHTNSVTKLFDMIKTHKFDPMAPRDLIIITHFPPVKKTNKQENYTSHPMYQNQTETINKYFSNDFTEEYLKMWDLTETELYSNVKVWMSGHTHYSYDFNYCTRFLSNQFGYQSEFQQSGINLEGIFEINQ